jgi:hypothetical protein
MGEIIGMCKKKGKFNNFGLGINQTLVNLLPLFRQEGSFFALQRPPQRKNIKEKQTLGESTKEVSARRTAGGKRKTPSPSFLSEG